MNSVPELDIGPLSWVKGEIDLALERAGEALGRFAAAPQDAAQLGAARGQLHQARGALAIVGLDGITQFAETVEALFAGLEDGSVPLSPPAAEAAQAGLTAIRHYLDDLIDGRPDQPLRLLPPYAALITARGLPPPEPSELFFPDLSLRPPRREKEPAPLEPAALTARIRAARLGFQRGLLKWLKNDPKGAAEMRISVALIEMTQATPAARAFWWVAMAFFDALAGGGIPVDGPVRRLCGRIDAQVKKLLDGSGTVADRLMRDVMYYVAIAAPGPDHLECVRAAYRLADLVPRAAEAQDSAQFKPVLRAGRELLAAAKDHWNRYCAGAATALAQFHQAAAQLAGRLGELRHAGIAQLAGGIVTTADALQGNAPPHDDSRALEVATALLLLEGALESFPDLGDEFDHQADSVTQRLAAMLRGEALAALEIPQLDAMSKKAQERLLMHQVAKEILASLTVVEQALDVFFRDPLQRAELAALARPLAQIAGALTVLAQDRAVAVLHECEAKIAEFRSENYLPRQEDFEEVAGKLSALGFFVGKLQYGPADIDAILHPAPVAVAPEAAAPSVEQEMTKALTQTQFLSEQLRAAEAGAASQEVREGLRDELRLNLEALREDARLVADAGLEQQTSAAIAALAAEQPPGAIGAAVEKVAPPVPVVAEPSAETRRLASASSEELDAELLAIFLEEAHEVLGAIGEHLPRLAAQPHDRDTLTTIRRSFHTLKGSGRMVGLTELGETAWAVEQTLNKWLQQEKDATPGLLAMLDAGHALFRDWVARLESGGGARYDAGALVMQCAQLRSEEAAPPPAAAPPEAAAPPRAPTVSIGGLEITRTLFDLYTEEARGHVGALQRGLEPGAGITPELVRVAHTLAGISATTGIASVQALAHALERALERLVTAAAEPDESRRMLLARAVGALEGMVGAVAECRMPATEAELAGELEAPPAAPTAPAVPPAPTPAAPAAPSAVTPRPAPAAPQLAAEHEAERRRLRLKDDLDPQLLPLFLEEAQDLMREIGAELRTWRAQPADAGIAQQVRRLLHTLKGSARMAGAMSVGELVHGLETRIELIPHVTPAFLDEVDGSHDRVATLIDNLRRHGCADVAAVAAAPEVAPAAAVAVVVEPLPAAAEAEGIARPTLRVQAALIDQLVNEAGEMAIARARIEGEMRTLKSSLLDLTENVIRLRNQLREIEIQAESQMQSQLAQLRTEAAEQNREFDPLEFDRFTRFQELTRFMAESVNDVSTVQHNLLHNLDHADAALVAQSRLNRELSQALMSVRMVPFNTVADRLYRIVRQTAKELDRRANLDIRGGQTELDRSVLEKMIGPIEHLLRNAVAHGLETPAARLAAGKDEIGEIQLALAQASNEILIEMADDGAGLDRARIRGRAVERGLLAPDELAADAQLLELIFRPGFSTAAEITEVAGRGVGLDVVRSETASLGGRIEIDSQPGRGARFRIYLPLTLAVAQAVLVRAGGHTYAIPSTMVEQVSELKPEAIAAIRGAGGTEWLGNRYPWHYIGRLLGDAQAQPAPARRHWLLLLKGGAQRIALEVDGLVGNQEIVVKNIGPQLARVVGIAGATVLGDGAIALILNPVALAGREAPAQPAALSATAIARVSEAAVLAATPIVMVVDDSLTVRKITGRLLAREGYHVVTAKDGIDALEQIGELLPDVMLVDIEMPRMDGFDLARNVRADARTRDVPIIMITSRIADKHRNYAMEIGVNHYLGKPYDEEELLRLIAGYVRKADKMAP